MNWYKTSQEEITKEMASNPNTPPEILAGVLAEGRENDISYFVAQNPNTPPEALAKILGKEENNWSSLYAALNPNCPLEDKVDWMEKVLLFAINQGKEISFYFISTSFVKLFKELKDKSFLLSILWKENNKE